MRSQPSFTCGKCDHFHRQSSEIAAKTGMTNRHQRRAVQSAVDSLPEIPNISGTSECCGNCAFSPTLKTMDAVLKALGPREMAAGRPAPQPIPEGDVWCLADPAQIAKRAFGWCGRWKARAE